MKIYQIGRDKNLGFLTVNNGCPVYFDGLLACPSNGLCCMCCINIRGSLDMIKNVLRYYTFFDGGTYFICQPCYNKLKLLLPISKECQ